MSILIVDDEEVLQDVLQTLLRREGYPTLSATTGEEALEILAREEVDLVLLDLMLPGMNGREALRLIRQRDPDQVVVVITAFSSIESAIGAMRDGAFHYIPKPFKNEEVLLTIKKGLEQRRLRAENRDLRQQLQKRYSFDQILGKSQPMQQVYELIQLAAPAKSNILVQGAFTGAIAAKKGLFEVADGGSIFFDEIGNIPLDIQAKLLRVIQEREFMRVGSVETVRVEVRIIAATNADLEAMVHQSQFREDLYYRLNVITVQLPPLRKRTEDIPLLAHHFLARYADENEKPLREISPPAMEMLLDYHWPGNVRELENVIERAVVLSIGERLGVELLPASVRRSEPSASAPIVLPS